MALSLPANGLQDQEHAQEWWGRATCWACPPPPPPFPHFDGEHTALTRWPFGFALGFFWSRLDSQCGGGSRCVARWLSFMCIHIYILFQTLSHLGYYTILSVVPCATQRDLAVHLFYMRPCAYLLTSCFCIPVPCDEKDIFFGVSSRRSCSLHRTVQLQLLRH